MSKSLDALENIKFDMEYVTRLDFVEPIVRGEVQRELYKIYHRERPELDIIEKELKALEIIKVFFKGRFSLHESKYIKDEQGNYGYVHFISFDEKYSHIRYPITQEEYDLLKEILE